MHGVIEFKDVSIKFNDDYIFRNLNLSVNREDKVLIYGRSGIGKSVLLKMLLGFVMPTEGSIYFEGQPVDSKNVWNLRRKVAYVSQDVDIGSGTVEEMIRRVFSFKANAHLEYSKTKLAGLFREFKLEEDTLNKSIEDLSGGERQRIAIIVAIMLERSIYLLDEVTAALDAELKSKVIKYFVEDPDLTVIAISHDKEWVRNEKVRAFNMEDVLV